MKSQVTTLRKPAANGQKLRPSMLENTVIEDLSTAKMKATVLTD